MYVSTISIHFFNNINESQLRFELLILNCFCDVNEVEQDLKISKYVDITEIPMNSKYVIKR